MTKDRNRAIAKAIGTVVAIVAGTATMWVINSPFTVIGWVLFGLAVVVGWMVEYALGIKWAKGNNGEASEAVSDLSSKGQSSPDGDDCKS